MHLSSSPTIPMAIATTSKPPFPLSLQSRCNTLSNAAIYPHNIAVSQGNLKLSTIKAAANPYPVGEVKSTDITVDPSRKLWFRTYVPTQSSTTIIDVADHLPVIVFFHGGGFISLSAHNIEYDTICRRFASKVPAVVVSVEYRLAPYHRFPAQYEDGFDVLKFLDENYKNVRKLWPVNVDLSRCFLVGDSAGGNIAHNVAVRACQNQFLLLKVIGVVAIQPLFGGEERTEAEIRLQGTSDVTIKRTDLAFRAFLPPGEGFNRDHQAINVSGPNSINLSKLAFPTTMVVIGGDDSLQDWQMRYYEWLKRSGKEANLVEYPNMCHSFYVNPKLPESGKLILDVANFIHEMLSK